MMKRVETRPADVRCSGLLPLEPDMEAYSAGSRKNLNHDEEKPHPAAAAGSKRKEVPKKIKDDEKEPHAAGSKKKKKPLLPDRTSQEIEEILQVKEKPEEDGCKLKTVKPKLTMDNVKHFEEYTPSPHHHLFSNFDTTGSFKLIPVERAAASLQAYLERRKRAIQQVKEQGFAELEVEILDDLQECDEFNRIEKFMDDLQEGNLDGCFDVSEEIISADV